MLKNYFRFKYKQFILVFIFITMSTSLRVQTTLSTGDIAFTGYIAGNLATPFLGIETIAREVNLSPSKLKTDFKLVYGTSMLQYHIEKKMHLAMQLILNTDMQIKSITQEVGCDGPCKFTATFKKRFGKLPSEVRKF